MIRWLSDRFRRQTGTPKSDLPISAEDIAAIEKIAHYTFNNKQVLVEAFSHRSYCRDENTRSNQRLEYLGDAVIDMVVSEELYTKHPELDEGSLTEARALLVRGESLAEYARNLDLGIFALMDESEDARGGRDNSSILADIFEALAGAMFVDGGYSATVKFIKRTLLKDADTAISSGKSTNYKSRFLEFVQARSLGEVGYVLIDEEGPQHDKTFHVEAVLDEKVLGRGSGRRLKEAEQEAAKEALQVLEITGDKSQ